MMLKHNILKIFLILKATHFFEIDNVELEDSPLSQLQQSENITKREEVILQSLKTRRTHANQLKVRFGIISASNSSSVGVNNESEDRHENTAHKKMKKKKRN